MPEIVADIVGIVLCGPAFAEALYTFLVDDTTPATAVESCGYPPTKVRLRLAAAALNCLGYPKKVGDSAEAIGDPAIEQASVRISETVLTTRIGKLNGKLADITKFPAVQWQNIEICGSNLLDRDTSSIGNIGQLFCASSIAFHRNASMFEHKNLARLTLEKAGRMRTDQPRAGTERAAASADAVAEAILRKLDSWPTSSWHDRGLISPLPAAASP